MKLWGTPPFFLLFFFKRKQTATCSTSLGCVWSLGSLTSLHSPTNEPRGLVRRLAGEHSYSCTLDRRTVLLCQGRSSFLTHAQLWEGRTWSDEGERDSHLASHVSPINLLDHWEDRCCSRIALTSESFEIFYCFCFLR